MLDLEIDPKLAWALKNRGVFPVCVNTGAREMLLRVPGLGARAVDKIIAARRHTKLRAADIARLTVSFRRAAPFLITADHQPARLTDRADLRARGRAGQADEPVLMAEVTIQLRPGADHRRVSRRAARVDCGRHCAGAGDLDDRTASPSLFDAPLVSKPRAGYAFRARRLTSSVSSSVTATPSGIRLLHTLVWRMLHGERALLEIASDPLVFRLAIMAKTIRRDLHKMHAFVRFRRADDAGRANVTSRGSSLIISFLRRRRSSSWTGFVVSGGPSSRRSDRYIGTAKRSRSAKRAGARTPANRRLRGGLDDLLREHLQSRARQCRRHAARNAEEILAQHAGDKFDPGPAPKCRVRALRTS